MPSPLSDRIRTKIIEKYHQEYFIHIKSIFVEVYSYEQ